MKLWLSLLLVGGLLAVATAADDLDDDVVVTNEEDDQPSVVDQPDETYVSPTLPTGSYHFKEDFDTPAAFKKNWIKSAAKKLDTIEEIAQYDGEWALEEPQRRLFSGDLGLVLKSKVKHAAIAANLAKPFEFRDRPLVVQYEVQLQDGQECGGSYLKLLTKGGIDGLATVRDGRSIDSCACC